MKRFFFLCCLLLGGHAQAQLSMEPSAAVREAWKQLEARRFNPQVVNEIYGRFEKPEDYIWFLRGSKPQPFFYYDIMGAKPEVVQLWSRIITWICEERDESWTDPLPTRGGVSGSHPQYLPDPERERLKAEEVRAERSNQVHNFHQREIKGLLDFNIFPELANRVINVRPGDPLLKEKLLERYGQISGFRQVLMEAIAKVEAEEKGANRRLNDRRIWLTPEEWKEVRANRERIAKLQAAAAGRDPWTLARKKLEDYLKLHPPVVEPR